MNNAPIGIFDSGVGGLTVMSAIISHLPQENLIYFGDTLHLPYGPRLLTQVRQFAFQIIDYLISQSVKIVVVACNTATAAALVEAQSVYRVPIIGVIEPGARGAVQATKNRKIGVIGTKGTISSNAYSEAVRALDAGATVYSAACPKFVEVVERGLTSEANFFTPSIYTLAKNYLTPLLRAGIDTLILGCTHYPILTPLLKKVCGSEVTLISSAQETANEVESILSRKGYLRSSTSKPSYRFLCTGDVQRFKLLGSRFLGQEITEVEEIKLSHVIAR